MDKMDELEIMVQEELAAQAIGKEFIRYLKYLQHEEVFQRLVSDTKSRAIETLEEIRRVLDDHTLDDPECFSRIEAIIGILEMHGISTSRHDW